MVVRVGGPGAAPGPVEGLMQRCVPGAVLQERHGGTLHYRLPSRCCSLANIFSVLAAHRGPCRIQDYSVSQTTLDQVMGEDKGMGWGGRGVAAPHPPVPTGLRALRQGAGRWGRRGGRGPRAG